MVSKTFINSVGPLPISMEFQTDVDGPVTLSMSGTAWTQDEGVLIGIKLIIDGVDYFTEYGVYAGVYANQSAVHMTLPFQLVSVPDLTFGSHTIEIQPLNEQTVTDQNDNFQVNLIY